MLLDGEAREYGVGQHDPEHDRHDPEHGACAIVGREQDELAPEDARAGHGREESGPAQVVDHVAEEPARVANHAQHGQQPQHGVDDDIELKQRVRDVRHGQQVSGERDDARRHDHAEIRGRQVGQAGEKRPPGGSCRADESRASEVVLMERGLVPMKARSRMSRCSAGRRVRPAANDR